MTRFSFIFGIFLLALSAAAIFVDHQGLALRFTTYAFCVLVIGCILYIRKEIKNEKK